MSRNIFFSRDILFFFSKPLNNSESVFQVLQKSVEKKKIYIFQFNFKTQLVYLTL